MKKEHVAELLSLGPNLFSTDPDDPSPYSQRGFEVSDGWFHLLKDLVTGLEEILASSPDEVRTKIRCSQVKEKFGGLRFYFHGPFSEIQDRAGPLVTAAEDSAWKTCQECGSAGDCRSVGGWMSVLCDNHLAELQKRRR